MGEVSLAKQISNMIKSLARELLMEKDGNRISKSKLGVWIAVIGSILMNRGIIDSSDWKVIVQIGGGILGIGIRDIFKK